VLYLIGWGNRLGTLYTWLRALVFTKNRGHRIITFEQAHEQAQEHRAPDRPVLDRPSDPSGTPSSLPVAERTG
jgi:NADH:ubiquinone reductase (H+-translocating)